MISDSIKCLIVDDIPDNILALEALLRRDGLEVLTASSGSAALELLLVHDVALAFLDVQMPEMDGFELAELMRGMERTKQVPIIFVTAGARDPQRVFKGYDRGAVDFLHKPIEPRVLRGKADVFFELYRQRRELTNALRLNEMFVGILGHDLRTPLGAMLMGAHMLQQDLQDDKHLRTLRRMTSSGQRMTDMIEQLLDLTRARLGGGLDFLRVRKRVDIANLVQRTVEELHGARPESEITLEASGDSATRGDPDRLLQVFSNLVGNAVQHGQPGTAVRVTVHGNDTEITICVSNRGTISPAHIPTIFDPFRRNNMASKSQGLGLGLFISQQIVQAHGGSIGLESNEREGTTFTVRVPRRTQTPLGDSATRSRTVLIVDHDQAIRASLSEAFEEEGYVAVAASTGQEALDYLTTEPSRRPDVVVLELVSPVVHGSRIYEAMQADPELAKIPVVVSNSSPARAPTGAIVIPQPLNLDRLLEAVASLWRRELTQ